jgi:hypothetical protein
MDREKLASLIIERPSVKLNWKNKINQAEHSKLDEVVHKWFVATPHPNGRVMGMWACDGWLSRWRKRHNIGKSVRLVGEAGDVNLEDSEAIKGEFRKSRTVDTKKNLFLTWKKQPCFITPSVVPNRSYICPACGER